MKQGKTVHIEILDPNRPGTLRAMLRKMLPEKLNKA